MSRKPLTSADHAISPANPLAPTADATPAVPAPAADTGVLVAPETPSLPAAPEAAPESQDRRKSNQPVSDVERRNNIVDRRTGLDRRVVDIGSPTGLERRRGPGCRRNADRKSAEEGEMTDEQFEFIMAVDTYKRLNNRPFPTWTEVLEVVKQLGYRKVAACTIKLPNTNGRASQSDPSN
jgi:hypothetical protein